MQEEGEITVVLPLEILSVGECCEIYNFQTRIWILKHGLVFHAAFLEYCFCFVTTPTPLFLIRILFSYLRRESTLLLSFEQLWEDIYLDVCECVCSACEGLEALILK